MEREFNVFSENSQKLSHPYLEVGYEDSQGV